MIKNIRKLGGYVSDGPLFVADSNTVFSLPAKVYGQVVTVRTPDGAIVLCRIAGPFREFYEIEGSGSVVFDGAIYVEGTPSANSARRLRDASSLRLAIGSSPGLTLIDFDRLASFGARPVNVLPGGLVANGSKLPSAALAAGFTSLFAGTLASSYLLLRYQPPRAAGVTTPTEPSPVSPISVYATLGAGSTAPGSRVIMGDLAAFAGQGAGTFAIAFDEAVSDIGLWAPAAEVTSGAASEFCRIDWTLYSATQVTGVASDPALSLLSFGGTSPLAGSPRQASLSADGGSGGGGGSAGA